MGMLWVRTAVIVRRHGPAVDFARCLYAVDGAFQVVARLKDKQAFPVIAETQRDLLRDQALSDKVQHQQLRHFADDGSRPLIIIRLLQHLTGGQTVVLRPVGLDRRDLCRLPAPGVVDQQLGIDAEGPVKGVLVLQTHAGDVAHGEAAELFQPSRASRSDPPEIRQRSVAPELFPVALLIQLGDADAVLVRRDALCDDVHGDFCQIQVASDARRGRDAGFEKHLPDHRHRQLVSRHAVGRKILRHIHEALVDGIDMDVVRADVLRVDGEDFGGDLLIQPHLRRRRDIGELQRGVRGKGFRVAGCGSKMILPVFALRKQPQPERFLKPLGIHFLHPLHHLEKPGAARDAVGLQRGGDRQADGFLGPRRVRDDKVEAQRVEIAVPGLHACVKGLEVDGDITALCHLQPPFCRFMMPPPPTTGRSSSPAAARFSRNRGAFLPLLQ